MGRETCSGTQSISPLLWSIQSGSLEAAEASWVGNLGGKRELRS